MTHSWQHGDSCHCRHYALICLSLSLFLLSHTLVLSWAVSLPFLPPTLKGQTSWSRSCKNSLPGAGFHFLFFLWNFLCCLGETSWCTDSWGDNSLFLLLSGFFSYLSFCVSRGLLFPLYCFSVYSAKLRVYFDMKQSESDRPEMDHVLKRHTTEGQHDKKRDIISDRGAKCSSYTLICNIAPGCPSH